MTFFAEASIHIPVPPEVAFDTLADHASWSAWMPRTFRPADRSPGTLRQGDRIMVRVGLSPVPTPIFVSAVDRPREIAWRGGVPGVLAAEHRFLFEPEGTGTRIRSVESWKGLLAFATRPVLKRLAERIGAQQLEGIRRGALARVK